MSDYKLKNVCDFDLAQTLECGQCFHFVKLDVFQQISIKIYKLCRLGIGTICCTGNSIVII